MKRFILFLGISASTPVGVYAQHLIIPNKPYTNLISSPGYITINEFTAAVGLKDAGAPFSKSFFGFTTIQGFQINRNFIIGAGTGISVYNGGRVIPLFLDFRFNFSIHTLTPYFSGSGGLLINPSGSEMLFINPGAGIRYALNRSLCITLGTGFFTQVAESLNSFVNFKIGLMFKPNFDQTLNSSR